MARLWKHLIVTIIFINLHTARSFECPNVCKCPTSKSVLCHSMNITSFPNNSFGETTNFNISTNNIQHLEEEAFFKINLVNVEMLDLSHNLISEIHPQAFYGLHNLTEIYLQDNNLKEIQPEMFKPVSELKVLNLKNNSIHFNDNTLQDLILLEKLSITMKGKFNECIFEKLKKLKELDMHLVTYHCDKEKEKILNWGKKNNVEVLFDCENPKEFGIPQFPPANHFLYNYPKVISREEFFIGIVIAVGVVILLITTLVVLTVTVLRSDKMSKELDDQLDMSDFEPYRGNLSPTDSKEYYFPTSRDNIPKFMEESNIEAERIIPNDLDGQMYHKNNVRNSFK
ncbi:hypothetical protein L9F63_027174 [Diploptera punctata]|uniref:Uncharacterized protein n=1 Tax=Diploptera punctata TaxID=6984 RepID=A0AAD8ABT9_DIPPU|nr:hypothetical protein L9F63_027174 [Diploptera punctata]